MAQKTGWIWFVVGGAALSSGCGGATAQITGKVTHDGQPVSGAEVVVESTANASEQYFGVTTTDGSLYISYRDKSGVPANRYKIRVTHYTRRDGKPLPAGEEGQVLRESNEAVGRVYIFEEDLQVGENAIDLKLEAVPEVIDGANSAARPTFKSRHGAIFPSLNAA